jgi:uncharacterized protein (DUF934 family)
MAIFKNGEFIDDRWRALPDGEAAPISGHVIFPYDWWMEERQVFDGSNVPLGLRIEPGTKLEDIADDIKRFSVIALVFPKFGDGRAFSLARLLRRCGFDAFDVTDPVTEKALREGRAPGVSHFYQPSCAPETPVGTRPWTRVTSV